MLLQRIKPALLRNLSISYKVFGSGSSYSVQKSPDEFSFSQWETIYQMPLIRKVSVVSRLKNYQAGLCFFGSPAFFVLETMGTVPSNTALVFTALGLTGVLTLSLFSVATTNLIGFVYVNYEEKKIRLGHINFWGKRKDLDMPISQLVPSKERLFGAYTPVKSTSSPDSLKLMVRLGTILNAAAFTEIFGTESF